MEKIKEYVEELKILKELKEQEFDKTYYNVKFSINVDDITNRRLLACANELGITRAEFTRDLVKMALEEVESQLNVDPFDFDSAYSKSIFGDLEKVPIPDSSGNTFLSIPKDEFVKMIKRSRGIE